MIYVRGLRLKKQEVTEQARLVAKMVDQWRIHFAATGVTANEIESLAQQLDRDWLLDQRKALRV